MLCLTETELAMGGAGLIVRSFRTFTGRSLFMACETRALIVLDVAVLWKVMPRRSFHA